MQQKKMVQKTIQVKLSMNRESEIKAAPTQTWLSWALHIFARIDCIVERNKSSLNAARKKIDFFFSLIIAAAAGEQFRNDS